MLYSWLNRRKGTAPGPAERPPATKCYRFWIITLNERIRVCLRAGGKLLPCIDLARQRSAPPVFREDQPRYDLLRYAERLLPFENVLFVRIHGVERVTVFFAAGHSEAVNIFPPGNAHLVIAQRVVCNQELDAAMDHRVDRGFLNVTAPPADESHGMVQ